MRSSQRDFRGEESLLLSDLPPGRTQKAFAIGVMAALVLALLATIPYARVPLPGSEPILPIYATAIVINDLLTAALLLALFSAQGSIAILMLACGYLLVGLLAIPWALTFPGVFADHGLLAAGQQTTASIAALRRIGFPVFVLAYALLKDRKTEGAWTSRHGWGAILVGVGAVFAFTLGSTVLVITHDRSMPALMSGRMEASGLWTYVATNSAVLYLVAVAILLARFRSVLDLWVLVALGALLIEIILLSYISSGRLSVGWWAGRAYGFAAASVVLIVMLWETTTLYARLVSSLAAERWARETRLASLEALSASIAHEVNQPLASMVTNADAGLLWLEKAQPDLGEARTALRRIADEGHRAGRIVDGIRTLFRKDAQGRLPLDLNDVVTGMLPGIRACAQASGVEAHVDLAKGLPVVSGNVVQLQQVVSNLASNAIEAMAGIAGRPRLLSIRTWNSGRGEVVLSVADTGDGIDEQEKAALFEPFVTTKLSGLGMGLMICRSIVEAHGGSLEVEPNRPHGSIFGVALPITARRERAGMERT